MVFNVLEREKKKNPYPWIPKRGENTKRFADDTIIYVENPKVVTKKNETE